MESELEIEAKTETSDPYAYLDRDQFTSEHFKIEVRGLPKYFGFKEFKKLLNSKLSLNAHKIKSGGNSAKGLMFVTFGKEEDRTAALKALNGYEWKKNKLSAELAKAVEDPLVRKRGLKDKDDGPSGFLKDESVEDAMKRVTIPWWDTPYEEQLKKKKKVAEIIMADMTSKIKEVNPRMEICVVDDALGSPVTEKYRNKCEFSIGYNPTTNEKMVGFRASSYKDGSIAVGPISHLIHLPDNMIKAALLFQDYVRSSSYDPFDAETHLGCWKQLTVRTTSTGQVMLIVLVNDKGVNSQQIQEIKASLIESFATSATEFKIHSFFFKITESHGQKERNLPELLFGDETITETLLDLKFRISPEAFFQVNVKATEVLYNVVGSLLDSNPSTTLLDVCCGTGTIGISVASKCGQVLGIEMVESAVQDARKNAELNGISEKCQFFAGKAENVIDVVVGKAKFENIVAIVDPPRAGIHHRVLLVLRKCERIKKLIYVSCDAKLAMKNFVDFTRPESKTYKGAPFLPKRAIPVDLFPHCSNSELVIWFEREDLSLQTAE